MGSKKAMPVVNLKKWMRVSQVQRRGEDGAIPSGKERRSEGPGGREHGVSVHVRACVYLCAELWGFYPGRLLCIHPLSVVFSGSRKSNHSHYDAMWENVI